MANSTNYPSLLFFAFVMAVLSLTLKPALSDDSPSPAPGMAASASPSPSPSPTMPPSPSPAPSPLLSQSPMAPSPHVHTPAPAAGSSALPSSPPAPPPADLESSPAPATVVAVGRTGLQHDDMRAYDSSKEMSGGKKAGIAFGVILSVCAVGLAGFVYKKRQENVRRAQYGSFTRSAFL